MIGNRTTRAVAVLALLSGLAGGCEPSGRSIEPARVGQPEPVAARPASPSLVGRAAPAMALKDQRGNDISLRDLRGQWVVLHFFPKDDTPGCTCDATAQTSMIQNFGSLKATVYGISDYSAANNKYVVEKYNLGFDLLSDIDHAVAPAYGAASSSGRSSIMRRVTVIIDPAGIVRYHTTRVDPAQHLARLAQALDRARSGVAAN